MKLIKTLFVRNLLEQKGSIFLINVLITKRDKVSAQRHKNDELKYRRTDRQKPYLKLKLENQNRIKYN